MPDVRSVVGVLTVAAGLIAAAPTVSPSPDLQALNTRLTSSDLALGQGAALIMGGSGLPLPPQSYVDNADALYLQLHGFTGAPQALYTPQLFFPIELSETQGAAILAGAINSQIADGQVDAANPVVVFGHSQSAAMSSLTMDQLHRDGVPSDFVHFVFIGNPANPNGGMLERFDIPTGSNLSIPSMNLMLGHPTPDLYPADIYTMEYDGFADFPRYPLNLLSVLNAFVGMFSRHLAYLGLTPEQIANAIPLETTDDAVTNYYMIPSETLPLLDLLRLQPIVGNPLADLLEPNLRILVNLGYGSIDHGWSDGPANVPTPAELFALYPPDLNWSEVSAALADGAQQGMQAAMRALLDPANYQVTPIADHPAFATLFASLNGMGVTDTSFASLVSNALSAVITSGSAKISDWLSDLPGSLPPIFDAIPPL